MTNQLILFALVAAAIVWPKESMQLAEEFWLRLRLFYVEQAIRVRQYLLFREIRRKMRELGMDPDAFQFEPSQLTDRDD